MRGVKSPGLRTKAIALRTQGASFKTIRAKLGIPLSTLSGWLRDIPLTKQQKTELDRRWRQALVTARKEAVKWHNAQKAKRLFEAKQLADNVLSNISIQDPLTLELALAFLYLGEGSKTGGRTAMGNSNPLILRFFLASVEHLYNLKSEQIRCYLHLRADQDENAMKQYWSRELGIPVNQFGKTSFDLRTKGRATYPNYKGVCAVECGQVAIQRRLRYIADGFCERVGAQKLLQ